MGSLDGAKRTPRDDEDSESIDLWNEEMGKVAAVVMMLMLLLTGGANRRSRRRDGGALTDRGLSQKELRQAHVLAYAADMVWDRVRVNVTCMPVTAANNLKL